ncbi:(deoxy)nucleoside triphosphate pyrophosphohydrolase [Clostridium folliculivorans]|uniref:8-oxo-dGTP diphosphatase n=1 Tax=Clostridium folliculivorans TaxID=2886038 RepID=A0A9W6DAH1_9CLOT|nr:(deoxy)nucleoside triphosphate pyrophosphohydrolase [Clostridium folliculivorans]GKU25365.1 NUDIX hydrolase [Clostridium folliculivorans]GKU28386.1 NUDIX hydrolase [Clostridium folliculivorans]
MKEVTAAIIIKNQMILIAQRGKDEKEEGMWEFPGGKIEIGETEEQCLKREIKEELDIEIEVGDFLGESIYDYSHGQIKLLAYFAQVIRGEIKLTVHSAIRWVAIEEIDEFNFAPADIPLVKKLKKLYREYN